MTSHQVSRAQKIARQIVDLQRELFDMGLTASPAKIALVTERFRREIAAWADGMAIEPPDIIEAEAIRPGQNRSEGGVTSPLTAPAERAGDESSAVGRGEAVGCQPSPYDTSLPDTEDRIDPAPFPEPVDPSRVPIGASTKAPFVDDLGLHPDDRRKRFCQWPCACRAKGTGLCRSCRGKAVYREMGARARAKSRGNRKYPPVTLAERA